MPPIEGASDVDTDGFDQPWQIHAFALSMALREQGLLSPPDWASRLGHAMAQEPVAPDGSDAHARTVEALEHWMVEQGLATAASLDALADSWRRAALATPHGVAIELANDPAIDSGQQRGRSGT